MGEPCSNNCGYVFGKIIFQSKILIALLYNTFVTFNIALTLKSIEETRSKIHRNICLKPFVLTSCPLHTAYFQRMYNLVSSFCDCVRVSPAQGHLKRHHSNKRKHFTCYGKVLLWMTTAKKLPSYFLSIKRSRSPKPRH